MDADEHYRLPDNISYEEWIRYVFDHPVLEPRWWWQVPTTYWNESADPVRTLSFLTQLFEKPAGLMERFSRAQIDQGLNFLVNNSCSNHMLVLDNSDLPWVQRRKCFDAMIPLYEELMASVYQDDLGHTQRRRSNPERPTFACYMWWDIIPISGGTQHSDCHHINEAVMNVFEQVLKLKAESCLESVLHGLGHWYMHIPERTEPVVRRFLHRTDISAELRSYAELAAVGAVQ